MSVPLANLPYPELLEKIHSVIPDSAPFYLVGGAVRDLLLSRKTHDMDFVLPAGSVMRIGRRVANSLQGAFFPLDEIRESARVILTQPDGSRLHLDFAAPRGPDMDADLRGRDFTINAIAISLTDTPFLLDPLNGASDLKTGLLRPCSAKSLQLDPVRILRGIRFALALDLKMLPEARAQIKAAASLLPDVSAERLRDELFKILEGPQPQTAIRILDMLGALQYLLPELSAMKSVEQSPPHHLDVWGHTLSVVHRLREVLGVLSSEYDPESAANWALGLIVLRLGRYRQQISEHMNTRLNPDRILQGLLMLAALYHDAGKPETQTLDDQGRIRFLKHEAKSANLVSKRAEALRLNVEESHRIQTIVSNHMRPLLLASTGTLPSNRAIYRFFRDCGSAGIEICLLSLADTLGTYGPAVPRQIWIDLLDTIRALMEAYWEHPTEQIQPVALVNGHDLLSALPLQPGPLIGRLLEAIREAQVSNEIHSRDEAIDFARAWLKANKKDP